MRFRDEIKTTMDEYDAKTMESVHRAPYTETSPRKRSSHRVTTPHCYHRHEGRSIEENYPSRLPRASRLIKDQQEEYIKKVTDPSNKYNIVEAGNMRPDSPFFEVVPNLTTKVVHYNMNHWFFLHMYAVFKKLRDAVEDDAEKRAMVDELKGCFDDLIHAYSEAYYDLDDLSQQQSIEDTIDELQVKWNLHLRKIYKNKQRHDQ